MSKKLVMVTASVLGLLTLGFLVAQSTITKDMRPYIYNFRIKMNKLPNKEKLGALQEYLYGAFKNKGDTFSDFEVASSMDLEFMKEKNTKKIANFVYFDVASRSKDAYEMGEKVIEFFTDALGDDVAASAFDSATGKGNQKQIKMNINLV